MEKKDLIEYGVKLFCAFAGEGMNSLTNKEMDGKTKVVAALGLIGKSLYSK